MPATMSVARYGASRRDQAPGQDLRVEPNLSACPDGEVAIVFCLVIHDRVIFISSPNVVSLVRNDRRETSEDFLTTFDGEKKLGDMGIATSNRKNRGDRPQLPFGIVCSAPAFRGGVKNDR